MRQSLTACAGLGGMRHGKAQRRQERALRSAGSQLRGTEGHAAEAAALAGGGGRAVRGEAAPGAAAAASPGPRAAAAPCSSPCSSPCCRRPGRVWLPFIAQRHHRQKTGTNLQSRKNQRLPNEIEQLSFPPAQQRVARAAAAGSALTSRPLEGRTRSLKCSGTESCCFRTRAETDKDIVKEKFGVAYYETESLKNLRTFGSISYLVNRTHIYSCVF